MKNTTKLIVANLFALLGVVMILVGTKMMGINLNSESEAMVSKILLVLVPQLGFIYMLFMSPYMQRKSITS